ncbi:hypothetical protein Nmel_015794 [Mimus melanotis]
MQIHILSNVNCAVRCPGKLHLLIKSTSCVWGPCL